MVKQFSKVFTIIYTVGVNSYSLSRDQIIDKSSYGSADNVLGNLTEVVNSTQEVQSTLVELYTPKISNNFTLDVKIGNDINSRIAGNQSVVGVNFVILGLFTFQNTSITLSVSESRTNRRLVGFFGDATLGYRNYAFLTLTGRTDMTSTLPYKNATYFYPCISGTVIWTDTLKLKSNWIDYGKLRTGYAKVGNDAGPNNSEPIYGLNALGFLGQPKASIGVLHTIRILPWNLLLSLNWVRICVS